MAKKLRLRVLTGDDPETAKVSYTEVANGVPRTRGDCPPKIDNRRRCPFVKCRHHLALLVGFERQGHRLNGRPPPSTIRVLQPGDETCVLDLADATEATGAVMEIADVGKHLGLRNSQVFATIAKALAKLRQADIDPDLTGAWPHAVGFSPGD